MGLKTKVQYDEVALELKEKLSNCGFEIVVDDDMNIFLDEDLENKDIEGEN